MASASTIFIAVIGAGGVGKCFLTQLRDLAVRRPSPKLSLCYISTSRRALYNDDYSAINLDNAIDVLAASSKAPPTLTDLVAYLSKAPGKAIIVDNTSSQEVAETYPTALKLGVSIVTPNKKAFSGSYQLWQDIFQASAASGAKVYHESSVGAGLPVISTLKDLVETGDEVTKIEGVFSGTMSFLFNSFAPVIGSGGKWSEEVKKAKALGYTEPDPRDDLNGLDVARKLTILARLAGCPLSHQPPSRWKRRRHPLGTRLFDSLAASTSGAKDVKVGLQTFDPSHPIAALKGSDNIISFYTKRYGNNPLIVQGAGAGGDVTAMGVTADLIKVIGQLA
ncbi:Homoserine dehydrogenase [Metarhizium acridum]|nr:Homoserine dehydrogenase [Metarhizium acridum]